MMARHARRLSRVALLGTALGPSAAAAATYQVGPGKPYADLQAVADMLAPGDVVEVDGGVTYPGGVAFWNAGEPGNPITIRGIPIGGARPIIEGGGNAI